MRTFAVILALATLAMAAFSWGAEAPPIEQLERQLQANPGDVNARAALAEACLRECDLERSLNLWQSILKQVPDHERAKTVVTRLTAQALDLDTHLQTLHAVIDKGITEGSTALLDAAAQRATTAPQKARILYLRGALAARIGDPARSRSHLEAALRLYPHTPWGARAAIALADAEVAASQAKEDPAAKPDPAAEDDYAEAEPAPAKAAPPAVRSAAFRPYPRGERAEARTTNDEARRLLQGVAADEKLADAAPKELAALKLVALDAAALTPQEGIAALRELVPKLTAPDVKRQALAS